ncbi:MAG: SDR family oxidoreductase [Verrucomicrobiota bacterium]
MSEGSSQRTVLVTGANRGIGLGLVRHYLEAGWRVIAAVRKPDEASELAGLGDGLRVLGLDLGEDESIVALGDELKRADESLDLLFHNAGISRNEAFGEWTSGAFDRNFRIHVTGPALLTQALFPMLNHGAKVVSLSSGRASMEWNQSPEDPLDAYGVSKAAMNMMTCRLAAKLKESGVAMVAISPGWVRTRMGGPEASSSVEEAVSKMAAVVSGLTIDQAGAFLSEEGEAIPW